MQDGLQNRPTNVSIDTVWQGSQFSVGCRQWTLLSCSEVTSPVPCCNSGWWAWTLLLGQWGETKRSRKTFPGPCVSDWVVADGNRVGRRLDRSHFGRDIAAKWLENSGIAGSHDGRQKPKRAPSSVLSHPSGQPCPFAQGPGNRWSPGPPFIGWLPPRTWPAAASSGSKPPCHRSEARCRTAVSPVAW
jgi:hypothetical protein